MRETWKKSRLSAAVALIVQCCGFLAAGIGLLCARKKESAAAFSFVGLISGVVGLYMLLVDRIEAMEFETFKSHLLDEDDEDDYAFDDTDWWGRMRTRTTSPAVRWKSPSMTPWMRANLSTTIKKLQKRRLCLLF